MGVQGEVVEGDGDPSMNDVGRSSDTRGVSNRGSVTVTRPYVHVRGSRE